MTLNLQMRPLKLAFVLALFCTGVSAQAAVIGTNTPARSLTRERIASLPQAQQKAWIVYLDRSEKLRAADQAAFAAEMKAAGIVTPTEPAHGHAAHGLPLDREASWYASAEARRMASNLITYQTPAGGWGKNMEMAREPRKPGERYAPNNVSHFLAADDFDKPVDPEWNYIGTIDNDATHTQLNFLARVITAAHGADASAWRAAFDRGMHYLLQAQYPNGGWPQVYPLEGGYHDNITFNDDAMTDVMELVRRVAAGKGDYAFTSPALRQQASAAFDRGIRCALAAQIRANGKLTGWAQQVDALTLEPSSGRNYEMPAISSGESAGVMMMLMEMCPRPSAQEQKAIHAVAVWFEATAIHNQIYGRTPQGRGLTAQAGAPLIWSRYYQIGTNKPIFGDRDKSIHDAVDELSAERRNGYGWYGTGPSQALEHYTQWKQHHPETK